VLELRVAALEVGISPVGASAEYNVLYDDNRGSKGVGGKGCADASPLGMDVRSNSMYVTEEEEEEEEEEDVVRTPSSSPGSFPPLRLQVNV
jgi:hypothetical protein